MKLRTVYAVVLTFEEKGEVKQWVHLFSLKGNASSWQRNFGSAIKKDPNARLFCDQLEQLKVITVLDDDELFLATHALALTWENGNGEFEQSIELFERDEEAQARREQYERAFADGSRSGRLIALTCEKTQITAPISEGEAPFRSYMDAVATLRGD